MQPYFESSGVTIYHGDCREVLPQLTESFDACISDPPYGLTQGKRGGSGQASENLNSPAGRSRATTGFMGMKWDGVVPGVDFWAAVLERLKPGAHMLAFGGTRTHHRLMCAIEDAGFEIRDCAMLFWCFGSGFPKSLDISKAIDRAAGAERETVGTQSGKASENLNRLTRLTGHDSNDATGLGAYGVGAKQTTIEIPVTAPATPAAKLFDGWGTALKPAYEPIIVSMRPLDGTFAENALKHGVAGINVDGSRVEADSRPLRELDAKVTANNTYEGRVNGDLTYMGGSKATGTTNLGRWPANVILDEEAAVLLDEQSGKLSSGALSPANRVQPSTGWSGGSQADRVHSTFTPNSGGASRFFYTAKSSTGERGTGNNHPTVKPLDLMRYLCKLICPPTGGVLLDPFMGSGSTIVAGRRFYQRIVGIELEEKYCEIAAKRLSQEMLF